MWLVLFTALAEPPDAAPVPEAPAEPVEPTKRDVIVFAAGHAGATLLVDGKDEGPLPVRLAAFAEGPHEFVIRTRDGSEVKISRLVDYEDEDADEAKPVVITLTEPPR